MLSLNKNQIKTLEGSNDGVLHPMLLIIWTLSIVQYSKSKPLRFRTWHNTQINGKQHKVTYSVPYIQHTMKKRAIKHSRTDKNYSEAKDDLYYIRSHLKTVYLFIQNICSIIFYYPTSNHNNVKCVTQTFFLIG